MCREVVSFLARSSAALELSPMQEAAAALLLALLFEAAANAGAGWFAALGGTELQRAGIAAQSETLEWPHSGVRALLLTHVPG